MIAQEKADELIDKMYRKIQGEFCQKDYLSARQCAVILIDEIIAELCQYDFGDEYTVKRIDYWQEVKNEILNRILKS